MTRKQFDAAVRKLSIQDTRDKQYHCRVEVCVSGANIPPPGDWRVMTDTCRLESSIPTVLAALADLLWIYVLEHHPEATLTGVVVDNVLTEGMKAW